jgi:hypothetical protein
MRSRAAARIDSDFSDRINTSVTFLIKGCCNEQPDRKASGMTPEAFQVIGIGRRDRHEIPVPDQSRYLFLWRKIRDIHPVLGAPFRVRRGSNIPLPPLLLAKINQMADGDVRHGYWNGIQHTAATAYPLPL